jgi:thioredoxin-related protein
MIACGTILAGLILSGIAATTSAEIKWTGFDNSIAQARKEKKPVLIDVYTDWCRWCKVMDSKTYAKQEVADFVSRRFIAVKMNGESRKKVTYQGAKYEERELAMKLGARGFPSTVFLDPEGVRIGSQPGYIQADDFLRMLRYVESGAYKKMKYDEFVRKK